MKLSTIVKKSLLGLAIVPALLLGGGRAHAAQIPYVPGQPLPTTATPQFNVFTNIPNGVGDESDFVKVRPSTGDATDNGTNGARNALYKNTLDAACNVGDQFDVRTYVHNGATPTHNPDEGDGSAVAHNTTVSMTAPLNTESKQFVFGSTIAATGITSVSDTGTLNCDNKVKLELASNKVKVYTSHLGWMDGTIDAVNGSIKIGSREFGSGDVWGCWNERVTVVYTVKVVAAPTPAYSCDLLTVTKVGDNNSRKYHFAVNTTARNGAALSAVTFNYGDGQTGTDADHTYTKNDTYNVVATATFTVNGQTVTAPANDACKKAVTVTTDNCKVAGKENLPANSPECKPATLPNTGMGAGSIFALFSATSVIGAMIYRMRALRALR